MMLFATSIAMALAMSSPGDMQAAAPDDMVLDELISFDDPRTCTFSMPTLKLFTGILNRRDASVQILAPARFTPALGPGHAEIRDKVHIGSLMISGRWHDLRLIEIERLYRHDETMVVDSSSMKFREPISKVRKVLNALGFQLRGQGHSSPEGNGRYYNINLFRNGDLTVLNCQ